MSKTYLNSNDITLFPVSFERTGRPTARLLTEQNILALVRGATGQDSFVITSTFKEDFDFEFVIHNYYVKCEPGWFDQIKSDADEDCNCIVARIEVDESSPQMYQIKGEDIKIPESSSDYEFTGVTFDIFNSDNNDTNETSEDSLEIDPKNVVYELTLLEKIQVQDQDEWIIPDTSKRAIPLFKVDGGIVAPDGTVTY